MNDYDFRIATPAHIENSSGKFFRLTARCSFILFHAMPGPISIHEVENLLNLELENRDAKREVTLECGAIEYIVSKTNRVLSAAQSVYRLSSRGDSFSLVK